MLTLRRLYRRLRALVARGRLDRELEDELTFHLELTRAAHVARGESPEQARLAAERELGGVLRVKDQVRDTRGVRPVEEFLADLRVAVRGLLRRPSFTAASLVTFALGVGGVAAVFGAVHGILLAPFPFGEPERLVVAWEYDGRRGDQQEVSPGNFLDWRARSSSFQNLAGAEPFGLDWISPEGPISLSTWLVSEGFFDQFRVSPLAGRTFRPDEHQAGRGRVIVLGYALWQRWFGSDPGVIGRVLTLDREPYEIIGVMPREFDLPQGSEVVWAPKVLAGWEATARTSPFYTVIGRLRDGVTLAQAQADLDRVARQLGQELPQTNGHIGARLVPLPEQLVGRARTALLLLLGAVGLVMLVAAANITSLQLARALERIREFSVRAALGAGRGRLTRQLVTETLVVALLGSGLGFALAVVSLGAIRRLAPPELPRADQLGANGAVLLVALAVGLLTAIGSGLIPALSAARGDPTRGLAGGRTMTASHTVKRFRAVLVTSQFSLALLLLVGAGLLLRSFAALLGEDRGFESKRILVLVTQAWSFFQTPAARAQYAMQATELLAALPGVEAVGVTSAIPLHVTISAERSRIAIVGQPVDPTQPPEVRTAVADGGFFRTLGIPLRQGRFFTTDDRPGSTPVALVNEAFARRYFADRPPVGQRVSVSMGRVADPVEREIVGVVGNVRRQALHEAAAPTLYLPHTQAPTGAIGLVIRTSGEPDAMLEPAKRAIWTLNASMPVSNVTTMERLVGESLRERRFLLTLLAGFALVALGLAATGIFGVMSYITSERTREIGVRIAFGADQSRVRRMVLADGTRLAVAGIGIGLVGAVLATRLVEKLLYRVHPLDPFSFGGGVLILFSVALAATWIPALRASRLDPVEALRSE